MGFKCHHTHTHKRERKQDLTHSEDDVKTEAETGGMCHKPKNAKECWQLPEARRLKVKD